MSRATTDEMSRRCGSCVGREVRERRTGDGMKPRRRRTRRTNAPRKSDGARSGTRSTTGEVNLADYDPQRIEAKWQKDLGGAGRVRREGRRCVAPEILFARDAAVSFRHSAHGPHAELHDWRRRGALQADARIQRAAPDGLGCVRSARGERRDQERHASARMDEREYRGISARAAPIRIQLRLAARNFHLRAGILQVEPVVFPADAGEGNRVPQEEQGELVSRTARRCWRTSR